MQPIGLRACASLLAISLTGCATSAPPGIGGDWNPVNRYASYTQEIPLHRVYVFHPSPMDGTLKNMLSRWARDSGMSLSYLHGSDFTLFEPVQRIHTPSLQQATAQLAQIYSAQQLLVTVDGNQLVVRPAANTHAVASVVEPQAGPP